MSPFRILKKTTLEKFKKLIAENANKRGRTPLFEYPWPEMEVKDSVVIELAYADSFRTIQRAAHRFGEKNDQVYITETLPDGRLGIQRAA